MIFDWNDWVARTITIAPFSIRIQPCQFGWAGRHLRSSESRRACVCRFGLAERLFVEIRYVAAETVLTIKHCGVGNHKCLVQRRVVSGTSDILWSACTMSVFNVGHSTMLDVAN